MNAPDGVYPDRRPFLPFRAVNRRGSVDFDVGLQRHHLLPLQAMTHPGLSAMFDAIGRRTLGVDDFRSNGLLLPCRESTAVKLSMPLHRGPHHRYNQVVIERLGQVECRWSAVRVRQPEFALEEALMRLGLLQKALRRRLLDARRRWQLSRFDPQIRQVDFSELDALADALWPATDWPAAPALDAPVLDAPVPGSMFGWQAVAILPVQGQYRAERSASSRVAA